MSIGIASGPRPTLTTEPVSLTERTTRRAGPDWLPLLGWFVEDGLRHSRINVIPLGNTTDPSERFSVALKFYRGSETPVHTYLSPPFAGEQNFRFEGRQLLDALGVTEFEGLVEITARSLDHGPAYFPWVDSWLEFYADDGSLSGSVPGFVFKGGTTKRVMSGKWQHWPGVVESEDYRTSLLLLNYHARSVDVRLDLFSPDGRQTGSELLSIPARLPRTFALETCVPQASRLLRDGFGALRVWSAYKLPGFVLVQNRHTGIVTSFDHTVPFAGAPID